MGHKLLSGHRIENPEIKPPETTLEVEPPPAPSHPEPVQPDPQISPKPKQRPKPPPKPQPKQEKSKPPTAPPPAPEPPPKPKKRPPIPDPPKKEEEFGILQYMKEDFMHTTMTQSMPLISKWFGRAGKVLEHIPGLQGVGKGYEMIAEIADGLELVYELIHEVSQAEAFEKGSKELVHRTKPVKKVAEKLIAKKYPNMPPEIRKKMAEKLEEAFEKYVSDPAIKKLKEKAKEQDDSKSLDEPLSKDIQKFFSPGLVH